MKLLLDENLSPRLVAAVEVAFPGSAHVHALGLGAADDMAVWQYARDQGFVIVTKDADYNDLSLIKGHPPKVVWVRRGNCSTEEIQTLLLARTPEILELESQHELTVLVLY